MESRGSSATGFKTYLRLFNEKKKAYEEYYNTSFYGEKGEKGDTRRDTVAEPKTFTI